ncbi:hypothetical protein [Paenilisteria weihenstephanensis]|nr:hypothetical protein [Listeria weihenstephanensis]
MERPEILPIGSVLYLKEGIKKSNDYWKENDERKEWDTILL